MGLIGQQEIDKNSADFLATVRSRRHAQEVETQARIDLDSTLIRVPSEDVIKAGETVLAKLEKVDPMAVVFEIDERTLLRLRRQFAETMRDGPIELLVQVGLSVEKDFPRRGTTSFGGETVDPAKGTACLRATIPNTDRVLLPGMFARVRLSTSLPRQALLVPESAVVTEEGRKLLYVVSDRDVVEARPVTLGQAHDDLREVKEGLKAGERVVVKDWKEVRPGMTIKPRPAPRPQP